MNYIGLLTDKQSWDDTISIPDERKIAAKFYFIYWQTNNPKVQQGHSQTHQSSCKLSELTSMGSTNVWLNISMSFSESWRPRLFMECLQLRSISALLGAERLVHSRAKWLGAVSIRKTVLPGMAIPMLKIRRPNGRLIFNMEITIRR